MISWPPVSRPRPRGANTGRNDGIGLRVTERVEKGSEESERPVVSSRRGNHPEGPRGEKGTPCHDTVEGKHGGCIETLTAPCRNNLGSWPVQFLYGPISSSRLERVAAAESAGAPSAGVDSARHRRRSRCYRKCRQPMAGVRPAGRARGAHLAHQPARRGSQADPRPNASDPRFPLARCRGLWPSGGPLDLRPGRWCHPRGVRHHIQREPGVAAAQELGMESRRSRSPGRSSGTRRRSRGGG